MWNPSTVLYSSNIQIFVVLFTLFLPSIRTFPDSNSLRSDLTSLNIVCEGLDSCQGNRERGDSLLWYNCHCGSFCRDLDTCCYDSRYRATWRQVPRFAPKCLEVYGSPDYFVFMVNGCTRDEGFVRDMCTSNGEDMGDPFLAVPVTSLRTGTTYKNYYCAVCNENPPDGQVAFWNVEIQSSLKMSNPTERDLTYDSTQRSWTMESDEGISTPVTLNMQAPSSILQRVKNCRWYVSQCSPYWTDSSTAEKCSAYTALVSTNKTGQFVRYKNPHCAICNFEQANSLYCRESSGVEGYGSFGKTFFVGLFALEEETKKNKCSRGMVYDGLSKKCRTVRCPKNHALKNRKCVPDHS